MNKPPPLLFIKILVSLFTRTRTFTVLIIVFRVLVRRHIPVTNDFMIKLQI